MPIAPLKAYGPGDDWDWREANRVREAIMRGPELVPGPGIRIFETPGGKVIEAVQPGDGLIGGAFIVILSQTGGSAGNKTTQCSFEYTVTDLLGNELGTTVQPEHGRAAKGAYVAATAGLGYYDASGDFALALAFEPPDVAAC